MTAPGSIVDALFRAIEEREDGAPRSHLGASAIGDHCARKLWYQFRWWFFGGGFDGRMLRLFRRGHVEEGMIGDDLANIPGVTIHLVDPNTGRQWQFTDPDMPAFAGSMDGVIKGIPEDPDNWHVLEVKTANAKSFAAVKKHGVEQHQPRHFAQMQMYMDWSGIPRALYLVVCKNDDHIYQEIVEYQPAAVAVYRETARYILESSEPPIGISSTPDWWECKFCPALEVCHYDAPPKPTCRTCQNIEPQLTNGGNKWTCDTHGVELNTDGQRDGCTLYRCTDKRFESLRIVA